MKASWTWLTPGRYGHRSGLKPVLLTSRSLPFQTGSGIIQFPLWWFSLLLWPGAVYFPGRKWL